MRSNSNQHTNQALLKEKYHRSPLSMTEALGALLRPAPLEAAIITTPDPAISQAQKRQSKAK